MDTIAIIITIIIRSCVYCCFLFFVTNDQSDPLTVLELENPLNDVRKLHKIRRSTDFEALKWWKGRSVYSSV